MSDQQKIMLETLRQSSVATAIYTSAALHIGFINEGMLGIWEHTSDNEVMQFPDLLPDGDQQYLASLLSDVWNQGNPFRLTAHPVAMSTNKTGSRLYADIYLQPILNSNGATESMIHTMQEVQNPLLDLHIGNMQSKDILADEKLQQWSRALSHDLRNPLSVAKLGMQYMQSRRQMSPEEHQKWVTMVIDALQSVETLITDVVEVSRKEAPSATATNVSCLVHAIYKRNPLLLGQDTSKLDFSSMQAVTADSNLLYAIFNLAIQSAGQLSDGTSHFPVIITCNQTANQVQYSLKYGDCEKEQKLVGLTVLEYWIQQIKGAEIVLDSANKQLILNFPIL